MPIYKYGCESCGYEFEELQKISDKPIEKCPKCSGKVRKKVTHSSFILKGSGWYATDYANNSTNLNDKNKAPKCACSAKKDDSAKGKDGKAA